MVQKKSFMCYFNFEKELTWKFQKILIEGTFQESFALAALIDLQTFKHKSLDGNSFLQ